MKTFSFVFILLTVLAGCASSYSGNGVEALPAHQVGVLEHDDPVHGGIVIEEIDGKWRGVGLIKTYRLSPGLHSIGAKVNLPFYKSDRVVRWIDVKPGAVYSVQAATDAAAMKWGFWIVDKKTGQRADYERTSP